jgi:carbonic anhydrase/acetyltransferase-like protein (isoleucine patch superfamily)
MKMLEVFEGYSPTFDGEKYIHFSAVMIGRVTCGKYVNVWPNAVVRGDIDKIFIGDYTNVQDNSILHVTEGHPLVIGNYVTIGHNCNLHSCTIGDKTLIGIGSIILDDAVVGKNCMIAAGSVVPPRKVIPDNSLFIKGEIKPRKPEDEKELIFHAEEYWDIAKRYIKSSKVL